MPEGKPPQPRLERGGRLVMPLYHISYKKGRHKRRNKPYKRPTHTLNLHFEHRDGVIFRPMYDPDGHIIGYIDMPIAQWASLLIL